MEKNFSNGPQPHVYRFPLPELRFCPVSSRRILQQLLVLFLALLTLNLAGIIYNAGRHGYEYTKVGSIMNRYFDFNTEFNFPTFFSSLLLLLSAGLLGIIYRMTEGLPRRFRKPWAVLGYIFLALCIEETFQVHEKADLLIKDLFISNPPAMFFWIWTVPYSLVALAAGLYFLRFLIQLPARTRKLFVLSGGMLFLGAIGTEFAEGYYFSIYGGQSIQFQLTYTLQETMEMVSIIIFIYSLSDYLLANFSAICITSERERMTSLPMESSLPGGTRILKQPVPELVPAIES